MDSRKSAEPQSSALANGSHGGEQPAAAERIADLRTQLGEAQAVLDGQAANASQIVAALSRRLLELERSTAGAAASARTARSRSLEHRRQAWEANAERDVLQRELEDSRAAEARVLARVAELEESVTALNGRIGEAERLRPALEEERRQNARLVEQASAAQIRAAQAERERDAAAAAAQRVVELEQERARSAARILELENGAASAERQLKTLAEIRASRAYSMARMLWKLNAVRSRLTPRRRPRA